MKATLGTKTFPEGIYTNAKGTEVWIYTVTGTKEELAQFIEIQRNAGIPDDRIMDGNTVTWRSSVYKDKATGEMKGGYFGSDTIELKFNYNKNKVYPNLVHVKKANATARLFSGNMANAVAQSLASQFNSIANAPSSAPVQAKTAVEELDMEDFNG